MKKLQLISLFVLLLSSIQAQSIAENVLQHAHAHNDYNKATPLWNALKNGCASIEIDVFAFNSELVTSHNNLDLKHKPTLTESYLVPLKKILDERTYIYPNQALILMIDLKSDSKTSLELLEEAIAPMKNYFTYYHNGEVVENQLKIVISGSGINYDKIIDSVRIYFFKDGSINDCEQDVPYALVPRGSASYGSQFTWKGHKDMPENELNKLRKMVAKANACNKKLRFYAMPANERIWSKFLEEGVYWINVDQPKKFKNFYEALNQKSHTK